MLFQDWILPFIITALILDFGIVGAFRLKNQNQGKTPGIHPHPMEKQEWFHEWRGTLIFLNGGICILSLFSSLHIQPQGKNFVHLLLLWGILGMSLGVIALLSKPFKTQLDKAFQFLAGKLHCAPFQLGWMVSALPFALLSAFSTVYGHVPTMQRIAALAWGLGVVCVSVGGWSRTDGAKPLWKSFLWATLFAGFAFLLRGTNTHHIPVALTGDEGDFGIWATQIHQGRINNLFSVGAHAFPTFFMFIQSIFVGLLGPTTQALRLPSAFIGALTVGGVYLLGKNLFSHRTGIFAGIFLVFFHLHIHFSRLGLNNVWDGFWYVVVLGAFWKGWETRKRSVFLLAGLGLGLSQYFYASARILPLVLVAWMVFLALSDRVRFRRLIPEIGFLFFVAGIVVLPLVYYYVIHPDEFLAPLRHVTIWGTWLEVTKASVQQPTWKILLNQLRLGILAYTNIPILYFYEPGTPVLRLYSVPFFVFGLASLIIPIRKPQNWGVLLWITAIAFLGAMSTPTPSAQRYVAAAPACALIIGVGLNRLVEWVTKYRPAIAKWATLLALLGILVISIEDASFYFVKFTPQNYRQWNGAVRYQGLAESLNEIPGAWHLVALKAKEENYFSNPIIRYIAPKVQTVFFFEGTDLESIPTPGSYHLVFVFLSDEEEFLQKVQILYPGGELIEEQDRDGNVMFWLYNYEP